ncbi:MAG: NAD(P)-binding domain-containing protein [Bacteroidota bacterium]|nr:NAD(P)-binding domain-containing protein [Flavisolibacter sp.]MDQ3846226.1 NAD(P)-binding domain-containing protein [Bacteroidota bacterium]
MKIGILGTGVVGETIGSALINKDHQVLMGSRKAGNDKAKTWVKRAGKSASEGTFSDAALFGEVIFLCLNGGYALDALDTVKRDDINGKILIDLTNPLDFTRGMPPFILHEYHDRSLGEKIQETVPNAYVVKTLNTVNCNVMVEPRKINNGNHSLFICGDDANAKNQVMHFLVDNFGWLPESFIDLGDIRAARVTEAYVPLWAMMYQALGTPAFSIKVVR